MKIGYARVSTVQQDMQLQIAKLRDLGVDEARIYVDHGFSGKKMTRDGLEKALAALREGDEFIVPSMDRLARNTRGSLEIIEDLAQRGIAFNAGGVIADPTNPMSQLFFTMLAGIATAEGGWISLRTQEAMKRPDVQKRLKARPPRHDPKRDKRILAMFEEPKSTMKDLMDVFKTSRASIYRAIERARAAEKSRESGAGK